MAGTPSPVETVVDLGPGQYQGTLKTFRMLIETPNGATPFICIAVRTPKKELIELQIRRANAYLVGFKGAGGWFSFAGETGGWGPSCGTGSNYNDLGFVGKVTYDDLVNLGQLARFQKGASLDKRSIAIVIAITSEAARFATVATHFVGLTNSVGTEHAPYLQGGVDFEHLKNTYFKQWEKPPSFDLKPGQLSHFGSGEILVAHR